MFPLVFQRNGSKQVVQRYGKNENAHLLNTRIAPFRRDGTAMTAKREDAYQSVKKPEKDSTLGTPTLHRVGCAGHGRHGGEASASCVGSDDVGLDSLALSYQEERAEIDDRSHRGPTGFLPIDPRLPTCQRRDDMGRKVGMTWLRLLI